MYPSDVDAPSTTDTPSRPGANPAGNTAAKTAASVRADDVDHAIDRLAARTTEARATSIGVLVWAYRTGRQLEAWLNEALEPFDLGTSDYGVLAALGFAGRRRQLAAGELSERLVQTTGGTTKTIQRLADRGLVQRAIDPDDGRRSLIELTDEGRDLSDRVLDSLAERVDADLSGLDQAGRVELLTALRALSVQLGERLGSGR